jgi:hypothetical protein
MVTPERALVSEIQCDDLWISTFQHPHPIQSLVSSLTPDEFELVIMLAVESVKTLRSSSATLKYKDALQNELAKQGSEFTKKKEELEKSIVSMERAHTSDQDKASADFQKRIRILEAQIEATTAANTSLRSQLEDINIASEQRYKSALTELTARHDKELNRTLESHKSERERSDKISHERNMQLEAQHKLAMDKLQSLYSEKEQRLQKEQERLHVSSEIGKQGEKEFEQLCAEYTKWGDLTNTSKQAQATDRSCIIRECSTLFEIKNYSYNIPEKEVTKFKRDLQSHRDSPLGVFISLKTNILGKCKRGFFEIEWTENSQMLVYVNCFYTHSAEDIFSILDQCVDIARTVYTHNNTALSDSQMTSQLQGRIDHVKEYVERQLKSMATLLLELKVNKKNLVDMVTKQHTAYICQIEESKQALKSMVRILLNAEEEFDVPAVESIALEEESETPVVQKKQRGRPKKIVSGVPSSS